MAKKTCVFCGNEYESDDKSVILFKSASADNESVRICSHCIKKCHELYVNKMAKEKQAAIKDEPIEMTPVQVKAKLEEWVLDQEVAVKQVAREYYNHLKRLKRFDLDNEANEKLRIDKSNMIYMGPTGSGKIA